MKSSPILFLGILYLDFTQTKEQGLNILARSSVFDVGKKFAIYCEGNGVPEPLNWYSPSGEVVEKRSEANKRVYVGTRESEPNLLTLVDHFTLLEDTGNWTCKAGEFSKSINIVIGEKVTIDNNYEELSGEGGKPMRLHCEVKGFPEPTVQWFRGTVPIYDNENRQVMKQFDDYILSFKRLTHADSGDYVCKAMQKALSYITFKHVKLTVQHKPILLDNESKETLLKQSDITYRTQDVFVAYNHTKELVCSAVANPPPKFRWYKRADKFDSPIDNDNLITMSEDMMSSILTVYVMNADDEEQYKCLVINDQGSAFSIFNVIPAEPPLPPEQISLFQANETSLVLNVRCSYCNFLTDEDKRLDPSNLPITAYSFQLHPCQSSFCKFDSLDESENDMEIIIRIGDPEDVLFVLSPLPNATSFRVRVRSISPAGVSEWLNMVELPQTLSDITPFYSRAYMKSSSYILCTVYVIFVMLKISIF